MYYRGKNKIINNESVIINLPKYVSKLASDFTIQITPICNNKLKIPLLGSSEVENNQFTVYGDNCEFYWTVFGTREILNVEPDKKDVKIHGEGPYKYYN